MVRRQSLEEAKEIESAVIFLVDCIRKSCRNPKPVILHSLRVGFKLMQIQQPKDIVIAGLLHDLIEDTECSLGAITKKFGHKVARLVEALTYDEKIKDYQERWHQAIAAIKKAGQGAMLIKVIDASDNVIYLPLFKKHSPKFYETAWKQKLIIDSFEPYLGHLPVFKEYERRFRQALKQINS